MKEINIPLFTEVDRYIDNLFAREDDALRHARESIPKAGMPEWSVTANQGKLLYVLAKMCNARAILELGTLGGYSTIWMARALPQGGRLITIDNEKLHASVAEKNCREAKIDHVVDIRVGDARKELARLDQEGVPPFDFVFIDADKESYPDYLQWSINHSHPGTLLVIDNVVRDGDILQAESEDQEVRETRRCNELLAGDTRISATIIPTVGAKGYDGMAIAVVTK
jgi:predicted O-methyltransferase YrrM